MNLGSEIRRTDTQQDDRSSERIDVNFPTVQEPSPASPPTRGSKAAEVGKGKKVLPGASQPSDPQPQSPPVPVVKIPEEGTDEAILKRPAKSSSYESDFYNNPTLLSRLILNQKYGGAIRRVFNNPEEAKVWVCAKRMLGHRTSSIPEHREQEVEGITYSYSIRQLPIHLACSNLSRTHDFQTRRLLNELISVLIFAFPEGAHEADHRQRLPIQEAVWYGAAPDTISLFLMANPEAINFKDKLGRSLLDLNRHRTGLEKESVQLLLSRDANFWFGARAEAAVRLQHNTISFPSASKSIHSMSVLASSAADEESIITSFPLQPEVEPDEILPLSWNQLEKRAIATEQILTEVNERNYELSKRVEALTTIDQAQGSELVKELTRLNQQNVLLNEKLLGIENLLVSTLMTGDEAHDQQNRLALAEISSLMGLSEKSSLSGSLQPVLQVTREAKALHKELSQKHTRQRERIRKLRHFFEEYFVKGEDNESSSFDKKSLSGESGESLISALTDVSARPHFRRGMSHPAAVDRTPPQSQHELDDLDAILRFAAAKEQTRRLGGGGGGVRQQHRRTRSSDTDDLSAIFHWAASKDIMDPKRPRQPSVTSSWSPASPKGQLQSSPPKKKIRPQYQKDLELPALLPSD